MKRRTFFGSAFATGLSGTVVTASAQTAPITPVKHGAFSAIPDKLTNDLLEDHLARYKKMLMDEYLPFWDKGGYDAANGGFICELYDNGSVQKDEKFIWYQGRGIWVYSHLYNNLDNNRKWLETARKSRDFLVSKMYTGNGGWLDSVDRAGKKIESTGQGSGRDIYGPMFAAAGLIEYYKAAGDKQDLDIALASIKNSIKRYEDPAYDGTSPAGSRAQGHSFMLIWTITQLLRIYQDDELDEAVRAHMSHVLDDFWNPEFGIQNESLAHDYKPYPDSAGAFSPGHSIETLWMVMMEAIREKNGTLFYIAKSRVRRYIEMAWDYIFEGLCDGRYYVFADDNHPAGPVYDIKTMWAMCEVLISTMMTLEYTGDVWAKEWYERAYMYVTKFMTTDCGVWRQAVDRYGNDKKRDGISIYRKGNFHQPRCLLYNIESLQRMIANKGKLTPFPL